MCIGVGVTTGLRAGGFGVSILVRTRELSNSKASRPTWRPPSFLFKWYTVSFPGVGRGGEGRRNRLSVNLTTHFHVVRRLRRIGTLRPFPLCVCMDSAEKTLPLYLVHAPDGIFSRCLGNLPWPVRLFTHYLILRALLIFILVFATWIGLAPTNPPGNADPLRYFLSSFEERSKRKDLGEGERTKEAIRHKTF